MSIVEVRKSVVCLFALGLVTLFAGGLISAQAQISNSKKPKRARRETNASRQARIARTIDDTYSHRMELFGGGGYLRFRSGQITQKNNEVSWAAAANYYLNPKLAIVGDARGSFGNAKPARGNNFNIQAPSPQINEYTFMGGVSYRFLRQEKTAVSVQALGGTAWGIFSGGAKGLLGTQLGLWQDGFRPAFSVGVSGDYNIYPNLAFRVTPTYVATMFTSPYGGNIQSNLGFNAGVIYRFGQQK